MKCPSCYALNVPGDTRGFACGLPLQRRDAEGTFWERLTAADTPTWSWLFIGLCALIPVVALGGCVPIVLAVAGCSGCLTVARVQRLPAVVRFIVCLVITIGCWSAFGVMFVAITQAMKK
jgi:hypothetical protein